MRGRPNLLLGQFEQVHSSDFWTATTYAPSGVSANAVMHDFLSWSDEHEIGAVTVLWSLRKHVPKPDVQYWCLRTMNPEVHTTLWDYAVDDETLVIPVQRGFQASEGIKVLSLFGGGFGGWSYAMKHLSKTKHLSCTSIAVESDLLACANYAINHRVPILNGFENLPVNAFHDLTYGGVVHASAVSYNWMDAASAWHPNIITISSPCQQWSGAGHGKGLYSMEGLLLPESICMSRFLQPEFIAVEQVSGFACHDHKHKVMQTISMCGYQVVWSRTVDLAWFGPLNRSRWLALLQRVVDMPPVDAPVLHFPTMSNWIPNNYDALFPFDDGLDTQLLISPQMRAVVHDVRYLPAAKRVKLGTQNAMTQRTHDGSQKFPVFMATYGVQHTLPEHLLQEKGCMAHFYADPQHGARLLHPHEMALLHGVSESFFAFNDFRSSWKHLGNQIAVQHALIPLTMACMTFDIPGDKVTVSEALQTWEEHRLKASQVVVGSGKAGTLMRHVEACCDLTNVQHEHIHDLVVNWSKGVMPSHVWWDVNGFHEFTTEVHSHSEGNTMIEGHQCSLPAVANPHDHDIGPIRSAIPTVDTSECTDVVHTKDTVVLPGDVMMPKAADLASEATTSSECIRAREVHVMSGPNQVSRSPVFTCVDSPVSVLPPPCSNQDCPMHDGEQCQSQSLTEMSGHHQNTATPVLPEAATPADAAVALSTEPTVCSGAEKPETAAISASEATALNESSHVPESHAMSGSLHVSMSPVTPAEHSPESVLSLPCCPTVPAVIKLGNQEHNFWIAADVAPQDLSALWHGNLTTQHTDTAVYITPDANAGSVTLDHNMLVTMMDNQLTVFAFEGTDLKSFCKDRCDRQVLYDQYGRIAKDQKFHDELLITPFPQKHCQSCKDALTLLAACHNCVITMQYVQPIDTIVVSFSGEQESRKIMAELYAGAIHQDTLDDLNRTCYVTHDPVMPTTQVHFAPADTGLPVPPAVIPRVLAIALTRRMMDTLMTTDGMLMQLKWESRPLWFGRIDQYATAEVVNAILQQSMAPMCKLKETRLVHRGKQFASGFFHTCKQENAEDIIYTFLIALEMSGGAGPAATKTQLRQQVRNGVAAWLLESGIELTWTHDNIEKILDDVGIKKLVPIVAQPASQRRDSQLHQAFIDASIQLPKTQPKVNNSPQILKAKSKRRALPSLDPSDFKVDCTYLLHEDGQPTTQISEFRANKQGVYMTDPAGALPWLRENQQLSTDELGMLVLGPLPTDTSLPTQEIVIPCYNSDANQVLLQLTLVQFGSKHLKMKDWDKTPMKAATSKVISITLWRQDWSSEEWEAALQHTTQFVKDVMVTEGLQTAITSCWGRSLRKGRQPATNKDATSIQIHAAIADDQFLPVLKLSGHNKLWMAPKGADGKLTDDFKVLWMDNACDIQKASALTAKLNGVAGLVRGKTSMGVRIQAGHFEQAWKSLHPNLPMPVDVSNKLIFKLEPLPYGCNHAMLLEWSNHVAWKFRPIKATGPKSWIVCAGDSPPVGLLAFNGHPVLPRLLPQRQDSKQQPIIAGPRKSALPSTPAAAMSSDPWATYIKSQGRQVTALMPPPAPPQQGLIEQRLTQQDEKVAALEHKLEAMQGAQNKQAESIQQVQQEIAMTEQRLAKTMFQTMDQMKNELNQTFGDALTAQNKSFEANLLALQKAITTTKRKDRPKEQEDMSDS